jgi:hypothetical protein
MRRWSALGVAALLLALAGTAGAQDKDAKKKPGPRHVIQIEAMKVEGHVQKPEAFYILQRNELNFEGLAPKKSFIPLILQSVEKEPF